MKKKLIFKGRGTGTAVIEKYQNQWRIKIDVLPSHPLQADENLVYYGVCGGKLLPLIIDGSGEYTTFGGNIDAVAIVRQNIKTGTNNLEMWSDDMINDEFEMPKAKLEKSEKTKRIKSEFSFENFFDMEFSWRKINGYIIPYNYKILQFLMSSADVYGCINKNGYYMLGEACDLEIRYFVVAVPVLTIHSSVFEQFLDKTYIIREENRLYKAVCVGVDKSGEFFVRY